MTKRSMLPFFLFFPLVAAYSAAADCTSANAWHFSTANPSVYTVECTKLGIGVDPKATFHIFSTETQDGFIGVGPNPEPGNGPALTFGYSGNSFGRGSAFINVRPDSLAAAPNPSLRLMTANVIRMLIANTGYIGIGTYAGTDTPADLLELKASANTNIRLTHSDPTSPFSLISFYEGSTMYGFINQRGSTADSQPKQFNVGNAGPGNLSLWAGGQERMNLSSGGQITVNGGISGASETLVVNGSIRANSVIGATYQDVAEWVPVTERMPAGTVVVVETDSMNTVAPSKEPYDTRVAGVVSVQPGLILGVEGPSKARVATTGRVRVLVDASRTPIRVGDLLVTSSEPGMAMRSEPVDISGIKLHRPGTILGKALEPLANGRGEILVLLSLQ